MSLDNERIGKTINRVALALSASNEPWETIVLRYIKIDARMFTKYDYLAKQGQTLPFLTAILQEWSQDHQDISSLLLLYNALQNSANDGFFKGDVKQCFPSFKRTSISALSVKRTDYATEHKRPNAQTSDTSPTNLTISSLKEDYYEEICEQSNNHSEKQACFYENV